MAKRHINACLQHNINQICRPFLERIGQIYAYSQFSVLVIPGKMAQTIYPPETENAVKAMRAEMLKSVQAFLEKTGQRIPCDFTS